MDARPAALLKELGSREGVRIGVHEAGPRPEVDPGEYDVLLSAEAGAPAPWVGFGPQQLAVGLAALTGACEQQPAAALVCAQVLRASLQVGFEAALEIESIAYSMLLASAGFKAWRAATPRRDRPAEPEPRVRIADEAGAIAIQLDRPASRNAFDAAMRDALCEALEFALEHPDRPPVILSGAEPAFSAGGDLDEFGTAQDVGQAHLIRVQQSPARLAHRLGDRLTARLHGACVGAGIEVPAAAARVVAAPGSFFRLPEVSMGLIPGAGGTASIPRRIGRHRAAYMAISGADIDLETALAWGLVDA
ncbi:MAG: enoyl-CoA hydratase/isomerase family protein [Phenylobacterium sp.]|nr:MAG: enoyl-CoA hydratase/isomerase family protein [Phenylobacterium sp.]